MSDIESIRKRTADDRDVPERVPDSGHPYPKYARDAIEDRKDLLHEVDRLSAEMAAARKDRSRVLGDLIQRGRELRHLQEVSIPHIEQQHAERMAERNKYSGQILRSTRDDLEAARAEVEKLRAAGKEMIESMLTGVRVIHPIEPHDQRAIDASREFCALIGAEMLREQKVEIEKLRAELDAARRTCGPSGQVCEFFQAQCELGAKMQQERDAARAELEALRAPMTDAEMAELEARLYGRLAMHADNVLPDQADQDVQTLLRALKAERARRESLDQTGSYYFAIATKVLEVLIHWRGFSWKVEPRDTGEPAAEVLAMAQQLAECRPVVHLVQRFQQATDRHNRLYEMEKPDQTMYMQAGEEMEKLRERLQEMPLPTLPEVTP